MELTIEVRPGPAGDPVLVLSGELDHATADRLAAAVDGALAGSPSVIGLDFAALSFIDSSGVTTLIKAYRKSSAAGCRLTVTRASPAAGEVLALTGLAAYLGLAPEA